MSGALNDFTSEIPSRTATCDVTLCVTRRGWWAVRTLCELHSVRPGRKEDLQLKHNSYDLFSCWTDFSFHESWELFNVALNTLRITACSWRAQCQRAWFHFNELLGLIRNVFKVASDCSGSVLAVAVCFMADVLAYCKTKLRTNLEPLPFFFFFFTVDRLIVKILKELLL
jgi:hypothetical protein